MDLEHISEDLRQLSAADVQELSRRLLREMNYRVFGPTTIVDLFITQACNLRCDYCFVGDMPRVSATEERLHRAVDFILAESRDSTRPLTLALFGGEPLLEKDLVRSVAAYARRAGSEMGKNVWFEMTTNGTLLDEDAMRLASELHFRYLLSLDGDRYSHDLHRRRPDGSGSFDSIVEKVPLIRAWDQSGPAARVTVNPDTVGRVAAGIRELAETGFNHFIMGPNEEAVWPPDATEEYARQLRELARFYLKVNAEAPRIRLSAFELGLGDLHKRYAGVWGCHAAHGRLAIDCEGRLFPCAKFAGMNEGRGECQLGTVDDGITEWGTRARVANHDPQTRYYCMPCRYRDYCSGGCLASNLWSTGSMYRPSDVYCAVTKAALGILEECPEVSEAWPRDARSPEHVLGPCDGRPAEDCAPAPARPEA
jgi:uncharacterized protein